MAGYTLRNLMEVDDMAGRFGLGDGLEARFARAALDLENFGLSYQKLAPNFRIPFGHKHDVQEEVYIVVSGTARMKLDDDIVDLGPWDAIRVPAHVTRALEAGPDGVEVLAIGAPQAQDTAMEQGWWDD